MFIFGALALALGLLGILQPDWLLASLGFEAVEPSVRRPHDYTPVFLTASSVASFNMGAYYVLAALRNVRPFFVWTVPFRCLTFLLFTASVLTGKAPTRFLAVGLWELAGALATGLALYVEQRRGLAPDTGAHWGADAS